jgi:hypothetical protein
MAGGVDMYGGGGDRMMASHLTYLLPVTWQSDQHV